MCDCDVCMPACFVRQTCIAFTLCSSHHAAKQKLARQQDPTWLCCCCAQQTTSAHCHSGTSQFNSKAVQASASCPCLSAACQRGAGPPSASKQAASLKPAQPHVLAINMKSYDYGNKETCVCSSTCLTWHSLATAELTQHVTLLVCQTLLGSICDHTTRPKHAGIAKSVCVCC